MCPKIRIGGRMFPTYSLMGILGFFAGMAVILWRCRQRALKAEDAVYIYVLSFAGGIIGAKLLYIITVLPEFIRELHIFVKNPLFFLEKYFSGGLVLYGGLTGAVITAYITARSYKARLSAYYPALLPALAVFSGFGRIGCFLAGCCYGVETALPIGVVFPEGSVAPSGVPLMPVQLIEACFDFFLFFCMLWITDRPNLAPCCVRLYICLYSAMRFVLEFFRGDTYRGIWHGLSTSQWIGIALLLTAGISLIRHIKGVRRERSGKRK